MLEAAQLQPQGWVSRFQEGDPRTSVAPLPPDPAQRPAWLVAELDAARVSPHRRRPRNR